MAYEGSLSFTDGTVEDDGKPRSAQTLLNALKNAERKLDGWQTKADKVDKLYSNLSSWSGYNSGDLLLDHEFNLFWASIEVVKPSIYSRPPVPVVTTKFEDRDPIKRVTAELLERSSVSAFDISDIDQVMLGVRDDLAIVSRGVMWLTYETGKDAKPYKERICIEWLDRKDFLHEPARQWAHVGWVARRAWLTRKQAVARFGEKAEDASYGKHEDERGENNDSTPKAGFWEIWSKDENRVFWVSEGCEEILDQNEPHLKLSHFFPCPRPAYGTLERRTLIPVPEIVYVEDQLESINTLTTRIHDLCEKLVVKGIVPAGTDIGDAVTKALNADDPSYMLIPVASMAMSNGGALVEWLPIDQVANAILSAVQARRELIGNVQEILGIADIMRGETEAQETYGAQQLKAQFGAVRIRDRVGELVRIARDAVVIAAEIMAEEFDPETLFMMAQMELPTDAEIAKQMKALKAEAVKQLKAIDEQAEEAAAGGEIPPEQIQQQAQQAIQSVQGTFGPQIEKLSQEVTVEQVKKLLRDDKTRPFNFDIETDSTIIPDENAEKQSRNEFMAAFATASSALAPMVQTGPEGAKLAGEMLKFQLGPYRAGRQLDAAVDEWIQSIQNKPPAEDGGEQKALIEAQNKLAEAEQEKARAAIMSVEAKAARDQAENERKMLELQQKGAEGQRKGEIELATTQAKLADAEAKVRKTEADIEHVHAQIAAIFAKMGVDAETLDLSKFKTVSDVEFRSQDQQRQDVQAATQIEGQAFDQEQRARGEDRQDRNQDFSEQQGDRQLTLAERQAQEKPDAP